MEERTAGLSETHREEEGLVRVGDEADAGVRPEVATAACHALQEKSAFIYPHPFAASPRPSFPFFCWRVPRYYILARHACMYVSRASTAADQVNRQHLLALTPPP